MDPFAPAPPQPLQFHPDPVPLAFEHDDDDDDDDVLATAATSIIPLPAAVEAIARPLLERLYATAIPNAIPDASTVMYLCDRLLRLSGTAWTVASTTIHVFLASNDKPMVQPPTAVFVTLSPPASAIAVQWTTVTFPTTLKDLLASFSFSEPRRALCIRSHPPPCPQPISVSPPHSPQPPLTRRRCRRQPCCGAVAAAAAEAPSHHPWHLSRQTVALLPPEILLRVLRAVESRRTLALCARACRAWRDCAVRVLYSAPLNFDAFSSGGSGCGQTRSSLLPLDSAEINGDLKTDGTGAPSAGIASHSGSAPSCNTVLITPEAAMCASLELLVSLQYSKDTSRFSGHFVHRLHLTSVTLVESLHSAFIKALVSHTPNLQDFKASMNMKPSTLAYVCKACPKLTVLSLALTRSLDQQFAFSEQLDEGDEKAVGHVLSRLQTLFFEPRATSLPLLEGQHSIESLVAAHAGSAGWLCEVHLSGWTSAGGLAAVLARLPRATCRVLRLTECEALSDAMLVAAGSNSSGSWNSLRVLDLWGSGNISDAGILPFLCREASKPSDGSADWSCMRAVDLTHTQATARVLREIALVHSHVASLFVEDVAGLHAEDFIYVVERLGSALRELVAAHSVHIADVSVGQPDSGLERLLRALCKWCPNLRQLDVTGCCCVPETIAAAIDGDGDQQQQLQVLQHRHRTVSRTVLDDLRRSCPQLVNVVLDEECWDAGIRAEWGQDGTVDFDCIRVGEVWGTRF
ncbi:hypothetical protein HDU84_001904 [Entophlyctis sp. JEL0112]|nr:hypothetical protein HDU84_001904 [Entophlyctis sp. JEL0112]